MVSFYVQKSSNLLTPYIASVSGVSCALHMMGKNVISLNQLTLSLSLINGPPTPDVLRDHHLCCFFYSYSSSSLFSLMLLLSEIIT